MQIAENFRANMATDAPDGAAPAIRWAAYLVNRIGVPVLGLAALCWFIVDENRQHSIERKESAIYLQHIHQQTLETLKDNSAALTRHSAVLETLNNTIELNTAELRRLEEARRNR